LKGFGISAASVDITKQQCFIAQFTRLCLPPTYTDTGVFKHRWAHIPTMTTWLGRSKTAAAFVVFPINVGVTF
jgi:hypothetical protein